MSIDQYDASTSLDGYYESRSTSRPARLWSTEKLVLVMAELGLVDVFTGGGTDPTGLSGYSTSKLWLRASAGVTETAGEVRAYDGTGTASLLASWPVVTRSTFAKHLANGVESIVIGSGSEAVKLFTRGDEVPGYGVPIFRAENTNSPTALDIYPNGTGGNDVTGYAWIHVLKQDLSVAEDVGEWQACVVAARSADFAVGSMAGGAMSILPLTVGGSTINFRSKAGGGGTTTHYGSIGATGFQLTNNVSEEASVWVTTSVTRYTSGYSLKWYDSASNVYGTADAAISRNAAGVLEINNGSAGSYRDLRLRNVRTEATTVSGLVSAATAGAGARAFVTDATATTFLSTVSGGGSNKVPVVSDGTNWLIG